MIETEMRWWLDGFRYICVCVCVWRWWHNNALLSEAKEDPWSDCVYETRRKMWLHIISKITYNKVTKIVRRNKKKLYITWNRREWIWVKWCHYVIWFVHDRYYTCTVYRMMMICEIYKVEEMVILYREKGVLDIIKMRW